MQAGRMTTDLPDLGSIPNRVNCFIENGIVIFLRQKVLVGISISRIKYISPVCAKLKRSRIDSVIVRRILKC